MTAFRDGANALRPRSRARARSRPGTQNWRHSSIACRTTRHVIHGDLLNRNILVDGERINAVLDWGNALYGDHLYDAAWLLLLVAVDAGVGRHRRTR